MKESKLNATVKVMRSYDYCHFECVLSSSGEMSLDEINDMRKKAAILVDESVRQYKIARESESRLYSKKYDLETSLRKLKEAKKKSKSELTPEEAALLRADEDKSFWKDWNENFYMYQDSNEEVEYHFNMLDKFKNTIVKA